MKETLVARKALAATLTSSAIWVVYIDRLAGNPLNPFSGTPGNEAAYLKSRGYRTQARYQENGITVALLSVG